MLFWSFGFLIVTVVAGFFGFISEGAAAAIGQVLFFVSLALLIASGVLSIIRDQQEGERSYSN